MRCGSAQATAERGFEDGKILDGGENNRESYISCAGEGERGGGGGHATFYEGGGPAGDEGQIPRG